MSCCAGRSACLIALGWLCYSIDLYRLCKMQSLTTLLPLLAVLTLTLAPSNQHQHTLTATCPGTPNTNTPWSGQLVKLREVENGSLYLAGEHGDQIYVLHVYGSPYSMGYAHGTLLKSIIRDLIPNFYSHIESEIVQRLKFLPREVRDLIANAGLDGALDVTHILTEFYTPKHFFEELRGVAAGSGLDYGLLLRVHMLPELVKAGCSMLGGWGKATANSSMMVQLRALDWDTNGPLQEAPTVVIYHPDDGNVFANVGWAGWVAAISGMSSKGLAISEKYSDEPFGRESRVGVPFNFLMRDILQFDNSLQDTVKHIQEAHRTCSIWLGVGDAKAKAFRLFEYSSSTARVFGDQNVTGINESRFNREGCDDACYHNYSMTDLVYWGVHLGCWNKVLHDNYGKLDPATVMQLVGVVQTGDLQAVVYDLEQMQMYVSNARGISEEGALNAYDRQFVKLDMNQLFKVPRPSL